MLTSNVFTLLPLLVAGVTAAPSPSLDIGSNLLSAPLPGYGVEDFQWELEVFPGVVQNFTGTIEQVARQATQINPDWEEHMANITASTDVDVSHLERRKDFYRTDCNPRYKWDEAQEFAINEGTRYLWNQQGRPRNGPGPGNCGRVSCSYRSAIWWCNDNREAFTVAFWGFIADGAGIIVRQCAKDGWVKGQIFHDDNWNVIVRGDKDNC
ncbi:hypothetical protein VFPPC_06491 [Pochonia chlamydosporia 170]|uniref:Secreted protein n=1 Tax=Pochonia chlamydosporia 170 TaxID=1380566 RepID=A0A179FIC9_METCM|nr:hypothetical protein VFPPC_06491 [Pochonia chlamydosporia 170]OAQ65385.1 hypothetical protein VFPPC_06491 [Pochonia chlamydosporia 170]